MVFPDKSFYVLDNFGLGSDETGNWGFAIGLDPKYAKKFYEREITKEQFENMNLHGKEIIKGICRWGDDLFIDNPYHFVRNKKGNQTLLLQFWSVPGNTCDLSIDGMDLERIICWEDDVLIEYGPHNVDGMDQASSLLAVWNQWATMAYSVLRMED